MGWDKDFITKDEAVKTLEQHYTKKGSLELEIAYMVEATAKDQARARETLIKNMRSLSRTLAELATALEANPEDYPNDLGPVQGQGAAIDTAAARYGALLEQGAYVRRAMHKINGTADPTREPEVSVSSKGMARVTCSICGEKIGLTNYSHYNFGTAHATCAHLAWFKEQPCKICGKVIGTEPAYTMGSGKPHASYAVHTKCDSENPGVMMALVSTEKKDE